jgi:DNA repair exonuclease SbcCD ATPase subunit
MSASNLLEQAKEKAPYQVRRLSSWTVGATTRVTKLPVPHRLEFSGLSTFKGKVDFQISPGVNVIYGAAHNGKTTIANAIMFGIYGELPARGMTLRYFTGRLSEKEFTLRVRMRFGGESSLYEASFSLSQELSKAKCTLHEFKGGESPSSEGVLTSQLFSLGDIQRAIMDQTGVQAQESVTRLMNLVYLQEERNYLLGTRLNGQEGKFIRSSLISSLSIGDYINSVISQGWEELKSIKKQQREYSNKTAQLESASAQLQDTSDSSPVSSSELRKRRDNLYAKIQQAKQKPDQTAHISSLVAQISDLERELVKVRAQLAQIKDFTDRDKDWQCMLCEEVIPPLAAHKRLDEGVCPICGKGVPFIDSQAVEALRTSEKETTTNLEELRTQLRELATTEDTEELQEMLQEYARITTELWEEERSGNNVSTLADEFAVTHLRELAAEADRKKNELSQNLSDVERALEFVEQYRSETYRDFTKNLDIRFRQLQNSLFTKVLIQLNPDDLSLKIERDRFEDFSKTERNLSEILFRLSLLDVFSSFRQEPAFMLIETPSQDLDESYKESLAMLLNSYVIRSEGQKDVSLVLTSLDPRFINQVFEGTERNVLSLPRISTTATPRQLKRLDEFF